MSKVSLLAIHHTSYTTDFGIPILVSNYLRDGPIAENVILQSDNGLLDMGPYPDRGCEDPDLINAGMLEWVWVWVRIYIIPTHITHFICP
ncbi:hypothetical protein EON65_10105 [archaeon]|nr:MAG: hypothetical protein EON65_10105 [archaeon]